MLNTHNSQLELEQETKQQTCLRVAEGPIDWKPSMKLMKQDL